MKFQGHPRFILLIVLLVTFVDSAFSSTRFRSGNYAHRAKIQWQEGNYVAAWSLYRNALSETVKEANLEAEALIKINLAHMEFDAMRFTSAVEMLQKLPMNHNSRQAEYHRRILQLKLKSVTGDCSEALKSLSALMQKFERGGDFQHRIARIPIAICQANLGQYDKALRQIEWAEEEFDEGAIGQRAWAEAWIHMHQENWPQAIDKLHLAFDRAQLAMRPFDLGYLLYYLGYCYEKLGRTPLALQFYERSFKVYNKIQLARPAMRSLKKTLDIKPNDKLQRVLQILQKQQEGESLEYIYAEPPFGKAK